MLHRTVSVFHLQNLLMWEYRSKNYKICSSLTACKLVPFQRKVNHYTTMYTKFNHLSGNNGASSIKGSYVNSTLVLMNNCFDWIQHSRHFKLFNNLVPPSINMIKLICCTQLKKVNGKNTMWEILSYSMCNDQMYLRHHLYRSYLFWTWAAITSIYQDIEQDLHYLSLKFWYSNKKFNQLEVQCSCIPIKWQENKCISCFFLIRPPSPNCICERMISTCFRNLK